MHNSKFSLENKNLQCTKALSEKKTFFLPKTYSRNVQISFKNLHLSDIFLKKFKKK